MSETIIVKRTGQAPLRVRGETVAEAESTPNNASVHYSGSVGRWEAVRIYLTATGRYVVAITHRTQWQGEHDTYEAAVYPNRRGCVEYLRDRVSHWMLQELIEGLGQEEVAETVE